jgi:hypothetical protein
MDDTTTEPTSQTKSSPARRLEAEAIALWQEWKDAWRRVFDHENPEGWTDEWVDASIEIKKHFMEMAVRQRKVKG